MHGPLYFLSSFIYTKPRACEVQHVHDPIRCAYVMLETGCHFCVQHKIKLAAFTHGEDALEDEGQNAGVAAVHSAQQRFAVRTTAARVHMYRVQHNTDGVLPSALRQIAPCMRDASVVLTQSVDVSAYGNCSALLAGVLVLYFCHWVLVLAEFLWGEVQEGIKRGCYQCTGSLGLNCWEKCFFCWFGVCVVLTQSVDISAYGSCSAIGRHASYFRLFFWCDLDLARALWGRCKNYT